MAYTSSSLLIFFVMRVCSRTIISSTARGAQPRPLPSSSSSTPPMPSPPTASPPPTLSRATVNSQETMAAAAATATATGTVILVGDTINLMPLHRRSRISPTQDMGSTIISRVRVRDKGRGKGSTVAAAGAVHSRTRCGAGAEVSVFRYFAELHIFWLCRDLQWLEQLLCPCQVDQLLGIYHMIELSYLR